MTEREIELTRAIADLKHGMATIAGNADLTDDDKRAAAPIEDAIADLEYNLREVMHDRLQDAALFGAGRPSVRRSALYTPNGGAA